MTTVESLAPPKAALPEFNGDLSLWDADVRVLKEAIQKFGYHEYEAQLPEIVGYIPENERTVLDKWPTTKKMESDKFAEGSSAIVARPMSELEAIVPETLSQIRNDIKVVTGDQALLHLAEIEHKFTEKGASPRAGSLLLHVDEITDYDAALLPLYLISNKQATVFYEGPFKLFRGNSYLGPAKDNRVKKQMDDLVRAPAFAIVRLSYATVHASPEFTDDVERTFMRIGSNLRPKP